MSIHEPVMSPRAEEQLLRGGHGWLLIHQPCLSHDIPGCFPLQKPSASDGFLMFTQQLASENIMIFSDNLDQAVCILGMASNQFGQRLDLALEAIETPENVPQIGLVNRTGAPAGATGRPLRD